MMDKFKFSARVAVAATLLAFFFGITAYEVITEGSEKAAMVAAVLTVSGGAAVWVFPTNGDDDQHVDLNDHEDES